MTATAEPSTHVVDGRLLAGRRIVVTGVLTDRSLAYRAAEQLQHGGAEVVLTGYGRARRITERAAAGLPRPAEVLELDVNEPADFAALGDSVRARWGHLDGVLHSIAYAPPAIWREPFLEVPPDALDVAMRTSVYSLQSLTAALLPALIRSPGGASVVTLTFMGDRGSREYHWMHVVKAALDALVRNLAVELGPQGVRVNALSLGPLHTNASTGVAGFAQLEALYQRAPLGWDSHDTSLVAGPACFLLSEHARAISGETIHVDGGYHALL